MKQRSALKQLLLKGVYNNIARLVYGDSSYGHWLHEKARRPSTFFHVTVNLLYYLTNVPRMHRVVSIALEPVYGCNLKCSYCLGAFHNIHGELAKNERPFFIQWDCFKKAVDQIPRTVESVSLTGFGEPLLHPQLVDMIEYISARGIRPVIYTNGTLLKGDLLDRLAASSLAVINFSIEPDIQTFEKYRGVDEKLLYENLRGFFKKKNPNMEVKFVVVAHPGNVDKLGAIYERWEEMANGFKVTTMIDFQKEVRFRGCLEPWLGNLNISTNGDVSICCIALSQMPIVIGNIKSQSLSNIINNRKHRRTLQSFISKQDIPYACNRCAQLEFDNLPLRFLK